MTCYLAVAVILYDSGLSLDMSQMRGHTRRVVSRLIWMGVPVTMAFAAVLAGLLLGMSWQAAVMTGAILVVSRPIGRRHARGARITARPADGTVPADGTGRADGSLLFLVRADGSLVPVTRSGQPPEPRPGDTMILLLPGPELLTLPAGAA